MMKIKSLEIYGYGQFVERKIEFDQYFTEIYGENEAGKSTIQRLSTQFSSVFLRVKRTSHALSHD